MRLFLLAAVLSVLPGAAGAQPADPEPTHGERRAGPGLDPDPALLSLVAGGEVDVATRAPDCRGFVSGPPDLGLVVEGPGGRARLSVVSNADTTLLVRGPDGAWTCDDDSGEDANPSLDLINQTGRYEIWVGTYSEGERKKAVLSISAADSF